MKKTIKRFWGIGLIVIILSSLFVAPASVSGGDYTFAADTTQPTAINKLLAPVAGFGVTDISQTADGTNIYIVGHKPVVNETANGVVTVAIGADGGDTFAESFTITYIDQNGNTGNAGTVSFPAGSIVGTTVAVTLAAGDTGILDVTGIAIAVSDAATGAFNVVSATTATVLGTYTKTGAATGTFTDGSNLLQTKYMYKSTNGGVTWTLCTATGATGATTWDSIAVAPDNSAIVAVVDKTPAGDVVYLSTNSGAIFSSLGAPNAAMVINDIDISVQSGPNRYIAVGGNIAGPAAALYVWAYGATAPAWYDIIAGGGSPPWTALGAGNEDVESVEFSSSFASDQAIIFVTENVNVNVALHVGSFNIRKFDALVDATFPRVLKADAVLTTCAKADIILDPAFYLGDEATQIGFIGAQITTTAGEVGGVFRSTYTFSGGVYTVSSLMSGTAIGSVAYDGTNLVAAPYQPTQPAAGTVITIYRSSNPLASAASVTFLPSSTTKTPGTGYEAKVLFNGTNVLCVSRGTNGGVARSADLGKAFNGIALVNTNLNTIFDTAFSSDAKVIYMTAADTVDTTVWRYKDSVWQRVMIIANSTASIWMVKIAPADPTAVVLALWTQANMYISTNSGETSWTARSCSTAIQDLAVETKDIIYIAGTTTGASGGSVNIVKSTNGAFTWGAPTNTNVGLFGGGNIFTMTLVAPGKLVVGGTLGGVAYSGDSGATWTGLPPLSATSTSTVVAATGLETGDTIFASSRTANDAVYKWKIGTNAAPTNWTVGATLAGAGSSGADGLILVKGILYILDDGANLLWRFLTPTIGISIPPFGESVSDGGFGYGMGLNRLEASTGSTTLWTINVGTPDSLFSWTEYLTSAADAPALVFPTDAYMLQVNSLTGAPNNFVFQWKSPAAISTPVTYNYDIAVYLDAAGLIAIVSPTATGATSSATPSIAAGTAGFVPIPGTTYYWRIRVRAGNPVQSPWSAMRSLTVQPLAASVPAISSPANGATIQNQSPAFSWSPVTSTTKYEFQLSTTPTFGTTVLTDTPSTAGALVPVTIKLEQGKQYFWRVRALEPVQGDWSAVANFVVAAAPTSAPPPVVITQVPAPTITIPAPAPAPTYTLVPPAEEVIAPTYIWAIIIIGAILVIAVIVLIVRTRRSV